MYSVTEFLTDRKRFMRFENGDALVTKICVTDLVDDYVLVTGMRIFGHKEEIMTVIKTVDERFLGGLLTSDNYESDEEFLFPYFDKDKVIYIKQTYKDISEYIFNDPDLVILGCGTTACCIVNQLKDTNLKIVVINQGPIIEDENTKKLSNFMTVWEDP